jgi:hypothetical protein
VYLSEYRNQIPNRFFEAVALSGSAYRLGLLLFIHRFEMPSHRDLQRLSGHSPDTIVRALQELEANGIIRIMRRAGPNGRSVYLILDESRWALTASRSDNAA